MKVISVVNTKGGTGKSTIAVNIASVLAGKGKKIMLFDMDEKQKSSMDFCRIRANDKSLAKIMAGTLLPELLVEDIQDYDNFDYVIIDAGPGITGRPGQPSCVPNMGCCWCRYSLLPLIPGLRKIRFPCCGTASDGSWENSTRIIS